MEEPPPRTRKSPWLLILLILFCYVYFTYDRPGFRNSSEYSRFYLVQAIVDHGQFEIDPLVAVRDVRDKVSFQGRYYSSKAPGASFLAVPAYYLLRRIEERRGERFADGFRLYLVKAAAVALPAALFLFALYYFWGVIGDSRALQFTFLAAYGLGTLAWPYSSMFYGHQTAAVALFSAFIVIRNGSRRAGGAGAMIPAGFLCGLAFTIEYPSALVIFLLLLYAREVFNAGRMIYYLLLIAILAYLSVNWYGLLPTVVGRAGAAVIAGSAVLLLLWFCRRGAPVLYYFILGLFPPLAAVAYYHQSCSGQWLSIPYMFENIGALAASPGRLFSGFTVHRFEILFDLFLNPRRGIFFYSPFLVFAVPGVVAMIRDPDWKREGWLFAAAPIGYIGFLAAFVEWEAGWSMGPRHLVPILPFLATAAFFSLVRAGRTARARLLAFFFPLFSFSLAVAFLGTATFPHFPLELANPVYEVGWRLMKDGMIAPNLGVIAGLPPMATILPVLAVVSGVFLAVLFRLARLFSPARGKRIMFAVVALLLSLALLGGGLKLSRWAEARQSSARRALGDLQRTRIAWYSGY